MPSPPDPLASPHLLLPAFAADAIQALIDGNRARLEALTGAAWPDPLEPPPLMDDALPFFRDRLRDDPALAPWWARLLVVRDGQRVVGIAGFAGGPNGEGVVTIGYSVYPDAQGHGYGTEAVRALVAWALAQPGVRRVRATIPPWNAPSLAVARRAGFRRIGAAEDPEEGAVEVWEIAGGAPS